MTALITGAASGLGRAFAERLARDGHELIVVDRDSMDDLTRSLAVPTQTFVADLAERTAIRQLEALIADQPIDVLVNNAGFVTAEPFAMIDPDAAHSMIEVHAAATMRLSRAALPAMLERGAGTIVNVASSGAFNTAPSSAFAVYTATKAFVLTFTIGLATMTEGSGVRVLALCPGWMRTRILDRAGLGEVPQEPSMTPETVVAAAFIALNAGETICLPTVDDPSWLAEILELERKLYDQARTTGTLAKRYQPIVEK